jgi:hypothetical protein
MTFWPEAEVDGKSIPEVDLHVSIDEKVPRSPLIPKA